jgi:hypothetical protein
MEHHALGPIQQQVRDHQESMRHVLALGKILGGSVREEPRGSDDIWMRFHDFMNTL